MNTPSDTDDQIRDISIWLDEYDDIFSDFDPRPYSDRALSDDFIGEITKVSFESELNVHELKLIIPEKVRDKQIEEIIVKRLQGYFRRNYQQQSAVRKRMLVRSSVILGVGLTLLLVASYLAGFRMDKFIYNMLFVILEPTGWFMTWTGLEELFYSGRKRKREFVFYAKLARTKVSFVGTT